MEGMNPKVDFFFDKATKWQGELEQLRDIILGCGLEEELKWGCPCYTYQKKNVVLIHSFKEYCALLFFKGALLSDTHKMLIRQSENVQSTRQLRFTDAREVRKQKQHIKSYVFEAIEIEKAGLKVMLKPSTAYTIPEELEKKLKADKKLKLAFDALTPGRQRGYYLYFSQAKQSKTRETRIEKSISNIIKGKGWNEM